MEQKEEKHYKPRIVVAIGAKAAGKDELADYLVQQYDVLAVEVGAFARKLVEESDPHLRYDVSSRNLANYGSEYVIFRLVAEILAHDGQKNALVITGVRTPAEAAVLKTHFGSDLLIAFVKVGDAQMRYERTKNRNFSTDPDDFQTFKLQDEWLKEAFVLEETAVIADTILWNNGSLASFCQQIEDEIVPHLFPNTQTTHP